MYESCVLCEVCPCVLCVLFEVNALRMYILCILYNVYTYHIRILHKIMDYRVVIFPWKNLSK